MKIENDILATLAYFDVFSYPLKEKEIYLFLPASYPVYEFEFALQRLGLTNVIYKIGDFYSLHNNFDLSYRRREGNERAKKMMVTARKVAKFLAKFPFVLAIGVSGSLSKEYADEDSDIDFFIITQANRLWIARTLMHLFKKTTFLFNKQHLFCMNYYIDATSLEIPEKNIYTATEIVTVVPCEGYEVFRKFYAANAWTKEFLPNNYLRVASGNEQNKSVWKKAFEALLNNGIGNRLDQLLMSYSQNSWLAKTKKSALNKRGRIMNMHATRHSAKPDPLFYQEKLVKEYQLRLDELMRNKDKISHGGINQLQ